MLPVCTSKLPLPLGEGWGEGLENVLIWSWNGRRLVASYWAVESGGAENLAFLLNGRAELRTLSVRVFENPQELIASTPFATVLGP